MSINRQFSAAELPIINAYLACEQHRHGDHEGALKVLRDTVDGLASAGLLLGWGVASYRHYRDRYRETAVAMNYGGHLACAETMP